MSEFGSAFDPALPTDAQIQRALKASDGKVKFESFVDPVERERALGSAKPQRLAMSLVLSAPPGSDPKAVHAAAREFGESAFGVDRRWGFVVHTNTEHPHAHLVVATRSRVDGKQIDVTPGVLSQWRDLWGELGVSRGIDMEHRGQAPLSLRSRGQYEARKAGMTDFRSFKTLFHMAQIAEGVDATTALSRLEVARIIRETRVRPTDKALGYAQKLAERNGVELDLAIAGNRRALSAFIAQHGVSPYEQRMANKRGIVSTGVELSADLIRSDKLSARMQQDATALLRGKPTEKMIAAALRVAKEKGLDAPDLASAGVVREFLNRESPTMKPAWKQSAVERSAAAVQPGGPDAAVFAELRQRLQERSRAR
jgi:hypothetical protein